MIKLNNNLQLREVNRNDWKFILDLRNRFYKDNFIEQKKAIEIKEHEEYMEKQNSNPDFH